MKITLTYHHVKQSDFGATKWFLSYTQKIVKECTTPASRETLCFQNINRFVVKNMIRQFLKIGYHTVIKIQSCIIRTDQQITLKKHYGRVWLCRLNTKIDYVAKMKHFSFHKQ